jgi:predicted ATPase/Tfp pilus assembly protein PilF
MTWMPVTQRRTRVETSLGRSLPWQLAIACHRHYNLITPDIRASLTEVSEKSQIAFGETMTNSASPESEDHRQHRPAIAHDDPYAFRELRKTLHAIGNAEILDNHPLLPLARLHAQRRGEAYPDTPVGNSMAMRSLLRNVIESLRPHLGEPDPLDSDWIPYLILHDQFLRRRSIEALAQRMALSRSSYFREQRRALEVLATALQSLGQQATASLPEPEAATLHPSKRLPGHNLPTALTPFVGREAELRQLGSALDHPDRRLITLVGLGGVGKTRLALEAALGRADATQDDILFVPLARPEDEQLTDQAAETILVTELVTLLQQRFLGSTVLRGNPKAALMNLLRDRHLLLLLDNFEPLVEGAALLSTMLQAAPHLRLLVTSRQRLNITGEWVFEVHGLAVPEDAVQPGAMQSESVQLFDQSARGAWSGFQLTVDNLGDVAAICRLVHGLPLGIELAATWTRVLSCDQIRRQIAADLAFLQSTRRDVPERHRSLQVVLDHTWQSLRPGERAAYSQLAVFRGGFSLDAATRTAQASPALLADLVDRSLVIRTAEDRFELHPLLQQYADSQLANQPAQRLAAQQRHADYFADYLVDRSQLLNSPQASRGLGAIHAELDNIRASWRWAAEYSYLHLFRRCHQGLTAFFTLTGLLAEGEQTVHAAAGAVRHVLEQSSSLQVENQLLLSRLLLDLSSCQEMSSRGHEAENSVVEALALAQACEDLAVEARCRSQWAAVLRLKGEHVGAKEQAQLALTLAQAIDLPDVKTRAWLLLGHIARDERQLGMAESYGLLALRLSQEMSDLLRVSRALHDLGVVNGSIGHFATATDYFEQSLAISRAIGDMLGVAHAFGNIGNLYARVGKHAEAARHFEEATRIYRQRGELHNECLALVNIGLSAHFAGNHADALSYVERGLARVRSISGLEYYEAYGLTGVGIVLMGLGRLREARAAFEQSVAWFEKFDYGPLAIDARGGLADIAYRENNLAEALAHTEIALRYLDSSSMESFMDSALDPSGIALTCWRVLHAVQDARAPELLTAAQRCVVELAEALGDDAMRRSFLENDPSVRALLAARAS